MFKPAICVYGQGILQVHILSDRTWTSTKEASFPFDTSYAHEVLQCRSPI